MPIRVTSGFTDTHNNQGDFPKKYQVDNPGPFIAQVKFTNDPLKMGRLGVNVPALSNTSTPTSSQIIWCQYLSPFYGAKSIHAVDEINAYDYKSTQHSYGLWAVPPDIDTEVLVIFAKGEKGVSNAFWIGCIQKPLVNQQIPAHGASENTSKAAEQQEASESSKKETYGTDLLPAGEKNMKMYAGGETLSNASDWNYPVNDLLSDQMLKQGLVQDPVRGPITSSARRESPSRVFGISTPGAIRSDSRLLKIGLDGTSVRTDRNPGHSFVMDDGDLNDKNQLTRIKTASGHQILMHDTEGTVYIANGSGKAFIEMDKEGRVSVFSDKGISLRSKGDFNLHSDENIQFHARKNIRFTAEKNLVLNSEKFVYVMGDSGILNASQNGSVRHYGKDGITSYTPGPQMHGAGGRIDFAGSQVHMNSRGASNYWGPYWLKPDHQKVGITITKDKEIDIDSRRPINGTKINKKKTTTTVFDNKSNTIYPAFVTHEPYQRKTPGREKDDIA